MMTEFEAKHIKPSILDEAATWQAKLSSGAVVDRDIEQHMEWLLADPAHMEAEEFLASKVKGAVGFEAAVRAAFPDDFLAPKPEFRKESLFARFFAGWKWPQYSLVTAAVAAMLFFTIIPSGLFQDTSFAVQTYAARGAGVETVHLADGSSASLFGGSEIAVRMEESARIVDLNKGRVFFDVVSNKDRPFYVNTAARQIRVVGTRFEVVRGVGFDQVAVNEGLVSVGLLGSQAIPATSSSSVLIEPGVVAYYHANNMVPQMSKKNPAEIGAWKEGVLTYQDASLDDIIATINSLFPEKEILLADEKLAALVFSGTLVVSSSEQMARQLGEFLALKVQIEAESITLASK